QWLWAAWVSAAREQAFAWRLTGLGSTAVVLLLVLGQAIAASKSQVLPYLIEVQRLDGANRADANLPVAHPTDAQIAFLLSRLITNLRSLSTDPVVVRGRWQEAYNYLSENAAHTLTQQARAANLFANVGKHPIGVEVIYVV